MALSSTLPYFCLHYFNLPHSGLPDTLAAPFIVHMLELSSLLISLSFSNRLPALSSVILGKKKIIPLFHHIECNPVGTWGRFTFHLLKVVETLVLILEWEMLVWESWKIGACGRTWPCLAFDRHGEQASFTSAMEWERFVGEKGSRKEDMSCTHAFTLRVKLHVKLTPC